MATIAVFNYGGIMYIKKIILSDDNEGILQFHWAMAVGVHVLSVDGSDLNDQMTRASLKVTQQGQSVCT
jgi:hypothetical protein